MKRKSAKKFLTSIISLLVIVYLGLNIYNSRASKLKTETILYTEVTDTYDTDAYIVRNETVVNYDSNKIINYIIEDSDAVAQGESVAYLFDDIEDAKAHSKIDSLSKEIKGLEQVTTMANQSSTNPDLLDNQINKSIKDLGKIFDAKDFSNTQTVKESLLYYLNERQLMTGKVENFNNRISQLKAEIDDINRNYPKGKSGDVFSPIAGYFVSITDGYENTFNYSDIKNVTADMIKWDLPKVPETLDSVAGKIISGLNWYVVCIVSANQAVKLPLGKEVMISIPTASTQSIPAVVDAVNQKDIYSEAAVILKCNYMNKGLSYARHENIKIESDKYRGFKIPKAAIHIKSVTKTIKDNRGNEIEESREVQGVYAVYGSELRFKEIVPLNSYEDFVICSANTKDELEELFTDNTVQLYDEVVVGGVDLYDGKIIK